MERLRRELEKRAEFRPTEGPGHGEELALRAASEGFPIVGAAGGDGTLHEVGNGLVRAGRSDVTLAIYPIGSANDYAYSVGLDPDWWLHSEPAIGVRSVDVGLVQSPDGRQRYFINGLGLGLNGAVNLEARRIKGLQGLPLYGLALFRSVCFRYGHPLLRVTLDGQTREVPTLMLTLAIGRREGNFILAPNAELDDGLFDYLHAGPVSRLELLRYVPGIIVGRLPVGHPRLWMGRCKEAKLESKEPLQLHIDGELFCPPEEPLHRLDVKILPGALRILSPVGPPLHAAGGRKPDAPANADSLR
jgi:diacylglycerol kinase family enzyme